MTRTRLLALAATATLALAACGGTAATGTPATTSTPAAATPSPVASEAPSVAPATAAPTASAAAEGPDLEGAAEALDNIRKYQIDMSISGMVPTASGASGITMSGLVDQDTDAYKFTMTGFAGLGAPDAGINFIVIGSDAWVDLGSGTYLKQPGGGGSFDQMRSSLAPATLLGQFPTEGLDLLEVGEEDKNGVATTHYHASAAETPQLVPQLGEDGVMDFWLAKDGGYLVSMTMDGTMDVEGVQTPVDMSIDLSRVNDPSISIEAPN